jgi:hypothetical protein
MWQMRVHASWRIFDPRKTEDRRFCVAGDQVSSLAEGLWIAEGPNTDWIGQAHLLETAAAATGDQLFVTFLPWVPHRTRKTASFKERLSPVVEIVDGLLLGTPVDSGVSEMLRARTALGESTSGLWSFGTSGSLDEVVQGWRRAGRDGESPILGTVAARKAISFALCLDDGVDMLFFRLDDRTSSLADLFYRTLVEGHVC